MIEDMWKRYPPGTDAAAIVEHFHANNVPYFRSDWGGSDEYRCPCIFGKFPDAYRGMIFHGDVVIVVMLDKQNKVHGIVKIRWLEAL